MPNLMPLSRIILYVLLVCMGFVSMVVLWWQIMVMKGKAMKNPDGSIDDWREQKLFYGMAVADIQGNQLLSIDSLRIVKRLLEIFIFVVKEISLNESGYKKSIAKEARTTGFQIGLLAERLSRR